MNNKRYDDFFEMAKSLFHSGKSFPDIETYLTSQGASVDEVNSILKTLKAGIQKAKTKSGVQKLLFAGLLLISGFLITCFNFHANQSFTFVMYTFTTLGLVLLLWGLYDIIG
jgi:hypothetical protein